MQVKLVIGLAIGLAVLTSSAAHSLMVERLENPVGVGVKSPRLGWQLDAKKGDKDVVQVAYRILVASTESLLAADRGDLWDSGKVESAENFDILYAGKMLESSQRVFWKVKTWTNLGESKWSKSAEWTRGIAGKDGWRAKWIGGNPQTFETYDMAGAKWIRSADTNGCTITFELAKRIDGNLEMAFSASGEYRIYLNGSLYKQSEMTDVFTRRLRFYNIGPRLQVGRNVLRVRPIERRSCLPPEKDLTFILKLALPDGRMIVSDRSWSHATELGNFREVECGKATRADIERVSPAFRKTFTVRRPVKSAVLHITAPGFYEASLNGRRVGDKVLDPSPTDYTKRVRYSSYRLDRELMVGENTLEVLLGHGWYDVRSLSYWNYDCAKWTASPRMIAQLEIMCDDGSRQLVVSDGSWQQIESPIGYDCIREGEVIGRRDSKGLNLAKMPLNAAEVAAPAGNLVAAGIQPTRIVNTVAPSAIREVKEGYVVEFPYNIAGWIRLKIRGAAIGDRVIVRYDERLANDGEPERTLRKLDSLRNSLSFRVTDCDDGLLQQDSFYPASFESTYEPRFTYNGFRYVWLRGLRRAPKIEDVVGCEVRTDFKRTATFECSNNDFNRLVEVADRSYRSNFTDGHPTDCPQREKLGWTGDSAIAAHFGVTFYDTAAVYEKWIRDIADCQREDGCLPVIAPTGGWGFQWGTGPVWDCALAFVPSYLFSHCGDRRAYELAYPALVKYIDYVEKRARGPIVNWGLSDWLSNASVPSVAYVSSCYYMMVLLKAQEMAKELWHEDDLHRFTALWTRSREAIRQRFMRKDGVWDNGSQTAQALPIVFDLLNPSEEARGAERLIESVAKVNDHMAFGLIGSRYVFEALSKIGRSDLAYKMIMQPDGVSFARYLKEGATTLPERWNLETTGSRNHAMHCDYATWAFEYLGGIRSPERGYAEFTIAPQPIDALGWVKAIVDTPRGKIVSAWRRVGGKLTYAVVVPPNSTAKIQLPGQDPITVGSGKYNFKP